jgi:hypothetical protein
MAKKLKPVENINTAVFAAHLPAMELFMKTGEMIMGPNHINEILTAYRNSFDQHAHVNLRCPACVGEFIARVYHQINSH